MANENNEEAASNATQDAAAVENVEERTLEFSSMNDEEDTEQTPEQEAGKEETPADKKDGDGEEDEIDYSAIEAPEGFELDKDLMEEVTPIFKSLKVSKEDAGKFYEMGAKIAQATMDKQVAAFHEQTKKWREDAEKDAEIGSSEAVAIACKAREKFGTDNLTTVLNDFKLGDHPEVIRFFYRVGKAISEDSVVKTGGVAQVSNRDVTGEPVLKFKDM